MSERKRVLSFAPVLANRIGPPGPGSSRGDSRGT